MTVEKYVAAALHVICGFHSVWVLGPRDSPTPNPPLPILKVSISIAPRNPCQAVTTNLSVWFLRGNSPDQWMDWVSTIWMAPLTDHSSNPQTTKWVSSTTMVWNTCVAKSKCTMLMSVISSSCKPLPKRLATPGPHLVRSARLQSSQKTSPQGQGCKPRCSSSDPTAACCSCPNSPL